MGGDVHPRARLRLLLACASMLMVLSLTACDGGSDAPPSPAATALAPAATSTVGPAATAERTSAATPPPAVELVDGVPAGAVGPLVVFTRGVREERTASRSFSVIEVVTYDLGVDRVIASFELGGAGNQPAGLWLLGNEVLVNLEHTLIVYRLDGTIGRILSGGAGGVLRFRGVVVSPDGSMVAVAERGDEACARACVVFIDAATGDERGRVPDGTPGLAELGGFPQPQAWLEDGSGVVVFGQANGEGTRGAATVMLDGGARQHPVGEVIVRVAPGGRHLLLLRDRADAWERDALGCGLYTRLDVYDLERDRVVVRVGDPAFAIVFSDLEWSPDSGELLYTLRPLPERADGSCSEQAQQWYERPERWLLLDVQAAVSRPVDDLEAVRDRWAGSPRVTFICNGEEVRQATGCRDDRMSAIAVELVVDGRAIPAGKMNHLLGFVELLNREAATRPPPTPTVPVTSGAATELLILGSRGKMLPPRSQWAVATVTTSNLNLRALPALTGLLIGQLQPGDEVFVAGRSPDQAWLAIPEAGWVFHRPEWLSLAVDPAALPEIAISTIVGPSHPPDIATGVAVVDKVISPVMAGDARGLADLAHFTPTPCTSVEYGPICPDGVAEGTPLARMSSVGCHGGDTSPEDVEAALRGAILSAPVLVHAVTRTADGYALHFRYGPHLIWLQGDRVPADGSARRLGIDREGRIDRIDVGCFDPASLFGDSTRPEAAKWWTGEFLLAPPVPPPATAPPSGGE